MAKDKEQPENNRDVTRAAVAAERVARARDDYFRELYGAWQETTQKSAAVQREFQERIAALSSSDDIAQAQTAVRDANRGYALAVQSAATAPTPDARESIVAERDRYVTAVEAFNTASTRLQQQAREQQQELIARTQETQLSLHERYGDAFRRYVAAHVEALNAAGDALDPAVAYTLAQQLLAVASHAAWLQRATPGLQQQGGAAWTRPAA